MKKIISFIPLLSLILIFELGSSFAKCPPAVLIKPCKCNSEIYPMIVCTNISNMHVLEDVFTRSADRKFVVFGLNDSSIMYLPARAISEKSFKQLILFNVTMTALFDRPPSEDNVIKMLLLKDVKFQRGIGWDLFGPMKNLRLVSAKNTEIRYLGKPFTDNINEGLTNLIFSNTKTRKIQYNAFAKLTKLFSLKIVNGEVKSLQRSMFATPSALEKVDFSGNRISDLPEDIFSDMPVLKELRLSRNKITVLSQAVFGSIVNRQGYINMEGNPLKCDCSMFWYVSKESRRVFGRCAFPQDQEGKFVQDLRRSDLDYCP